MNLFQLVEDDHKQEFMNNVEKLFNKKTSSFSLEIAFKKRNGSAFWSDFAVSVITNIHNPNSAIAIAADITEKKEAQEKSMKQNDMLLELVETKNKFISMLAHEFHELFDPAGVVFLLRIFFL